MLVAESELRRAEIRAARGEKRASELEEQLQAAADRLRQLEKTESVNSCREDDDEEVVRSLQSQLQHAEDRLEIAQRESSKRQKELDETEEKLLECKIKIQKTREELDSCLSQIQNL